MIMIINNVPGNLRVRKTDDKFMGLRIRLIPSYFKSFVETFENDRHANREQLRTFVSETS